MRYLLDVNVLVAWGWRDHADHARVCQWMNALSHRQGDTLLTSAIPELGFVRVSVQRSGGSVTTSVAAGVLRGLLKSVARMHRFLPDDQDALTWPAWCRGAARTTDAHLLTLAKAHGASLATLDAGIPGAFLIPPATAAIP
jgi:predicted nucleic acid-binding protein